MAVALLIHGLQMPGGMAHCVEAGRYIRSFDVGKHDGLGEIATTPRISEAAHFASAGDALAFYQTQSQVKPLRPDGKPNRPLTAFTVELVQVRV